jgi:predicted RNA-binding Zn ribbon-like protein
VSEPHLTRLPTLIPAGADDLCLGFANTRFWRGSSEPTETLAGFAELLQWLEGNAALPEGAVDQASDDPDREIAIFDEAIEMREAIYRMFSAIAANQSVDDADLGALNDALQGAPSRRKLTGGGAGYAWVTAASGLTAAILLAPVIWSSADLLAQAGRRRIRRCANDQCLWLFVDNSKSGTRRWCDMAACGNRAKARRHYLKTKGG